MKVVFLLSFKQCTQNKLRHKSLQAATKRAVPWLEEFIQDIAERKVTTLHSAVHSEWPLHSAWVPSHNEAWSKSQRPSEAENVTVAPWNHFLHASRTHIYSLPLPAERAHTGYITLKFCLAKYLWYCQNNKNIRGEVWRGRPMHVKKHARN